MYRKFFNDYDTIKHNMSTLNSLIFTTTSFVPLPRIFKFKSYREFIYVGANNNLKPNTIVLISGLVSLFFWA